MDGPVWCFSRFGTSLTELPDGRFVQIGGEHEDFYDPDFCIYNDVTVQKLPILRIVEQHIGHRNAGWKWSNTKFDPSGPRNYSRLYSLSFLCNVLRLMPSLAAALVWTRLQLAMTWAMSSFSTRPTT